MSGLTPPETATDDGGGCIDPAEFLISNPTYHDCFLTVIDPDTKNVMKIGAVSSDLASHSLVFRKMLNAQGGLKNIEVTDVSAHVAKLMLTHMYGGKMPSMDRATRAQLALAAHAYDIRYLLDDCCQVLVPTTVDELFPALVCAVHLDNAALLPHVKKIIKEKTNEVIKHGEFLKLDAKCIEFIASEDVLAVDELDLWKALAKWATTSAGKGGNKSVREVMNPVLRFVRLATLTPEEVMKEVLPTKIFNDSEVVQVMSAVFAKTPLDCPGLSGNTEIRCKNSNRRSGGKPVVEESMRPGSYFKNFTSSQPAEFAGLKSSTISLTPQTSTELQSFTMHTNSYTGQDNIRCKISYNLSVMAKEISSTDYTRVASAKNVTVEAFCDVDIPLSIELKDKNGQNFILSEGRTYHLTLNLTTIHPAYFQYETHLNAQGFRYILLTDYCHFKGLSYKILSSSS